MHSIPENTMKSELILYGTQGCHLCDEAESIVLPLAQTYRLGLVLTDIAGNEDLETRYAILIPVLRYGSHELAWPFDHVAVNQFLTSTVNT